VPADLSLYALGSGSDYTPFLQHAGVASLDIYYGGEDEGGTYHSIFDSFDHYLRFGDPKFDYGIALAQTVGRAVLRVANADVLPFDFTGFSDAIEKYEKEVTKLLDDTRNKSNETNKFLDDKTYENVSDPTKTFVPPKRKDAVPYLNFAPLQNAVTRLKQSAREYGKAYNAKISDGRAHDLNIERSLDQILLKTERALTRDEGIPGRPWYKHMVYAPGLYAGYGVKTLPLIREAIELRKWKEGEDGVTVTAAVLERYADEIDRATALLKNAK
jgi:N-acetylated-alpha-linked acidic dipeptidase